MLPRTILESDVSFYEKIKNEHERLMLATDVRGTLPVFPSSDMLQHNQLARFDCFQEPSFLYTCYKCASFQMRVESDASFNEKMKDEHEISMLAADTRGILPVFQTNDRLHANACNHRTW